MAADENSLANFGLVIAYVLPGFTALQGFPLVAPAAAGWGTGGTRTRRSPRFSPGR